MKKAFLLLASAALLFAGCRKEQLTQTAEKDGNEVTVTFTAGLTPEGTKATIDGDGAGENVNHWVLEVHDNQGLFYEVERDVAKGTSEQTYQLKLFKNQTYTLLFWADTKGAYNTDDLTSVSKSGFTANADSLDAFSASVPYTSLVSESKNVTLTRPFGQLNIITTDLAALKTQVEESAYDKYAPNTFNVKVEIPTSFNVKDQKAGDITETELYAAEIYGNFNEPDSRGTTLFMDYIFASAESADVRDIGFSFYSNFNEIKYKFGNIPLQRNYRTNIKGRLMSNDSEWKVVIDPIWNTPEYTKGL